MAQAKPKTKPASKAKSAPKKSAKTKAKAPAKTKTKAKTKARAKAKPAAKSKAKTTHKAHPPKLAKKTKAKAKVKSKSKTEFNDSQKEKLLIQIENIVMLHRHREGGLKSLTNIDRILDHYNQRYTHPTDKFDAIIKLGMESDDHSHHFFMLVNGRDENEENLYKLLTAIGHDKVKFDEASKKMDEIYEGSEKG